MGAYVDDEVIEVVTPDLEIGSRIAGEITLAVHDQSQPQVVDGQRREKPCFRR